MRHTFITSDLHLYHDNIIKHCNRPWSDGLEMTRELIAIWNSVVRPEDEVYHVGDFALLNGSRKVALGLIVDALHKLNGHIYLIPGSHDQIIYQLPENPKWTITPHIVGLKMHGRRLVLCHYPMTDWPWSRHGSFLMHGHLHGRPYGTGSLVGPGRQWDCGVDSHAYFPWNEDEIQARMISYECVPDEKDIARGEGSA